jgi:putative Mg2+ transporter-C (MgtC) family protein
MDTADIVGRLILAALAGSILGLNRDLHDKLTGVRTLGLAGLASALIVIAVGRDGPARMRRPQPLSIREP